MATDPKSRARDAFADLPTPEKTAFVIEATFQTIGEALRETGQRLADVINEFDPESFFDAGTEEEDGAPTPDAKRAAATKPAATASAATKPKAAPRAKKPDSKTTKKTAGKTAGRKKKDDES